MRLAIGFAAGVIVALGGLVLYFVTGFAPVAVTDPPLPMEGLIAHISLDSHLRREKTVQPSVPADEPNYLLGAAVYKEHCAVCHGLPGREKTAVAAGLFPEPPELLRGTGVTDDSAWETYWKAKNGIRLTGMPGFKDRLSETQLWQVSQLLKNADKLPASVKSALAADPVFQAATK